MLEFIIARYNYWIVITLMMVGLYTVFARGNLVKTVIGLNLFQTSVFIFYITVSKVVPGTAPILIEDKGKAKDAKAHGGDHAGEHGGSISEAPVGLFAEGPAPASGDHGAAPGVPLADQSEALHGEPGSVPVNQLPEQGSAPDAAAESLHLQPPGAPANELFANPLPEEASRVAADGVQAAGEILYSNPLPHVLILTAIVVGVATTAVGLALSVRIREAYGTVEEDALEEMDNESDVAGAAL